MLAEPRVEQREERPYVAIRSRLPMSELPTVIPRDIGAVIEWMGQNGVAMAGAPFVRYHAVDLERGLEIEVGVPVGGAVPGGDGVESGAFPAGRYAAVVHIGHYDRLVDTHAALQDWVRRRGLSIRKARPGSRSRRSRTSRIPRRSPISPGTRPRSPTFSVVG